MDNSDYMIIFSIFMIGLMVGTTIGFIFTVNESKQIMHNMADSPYTIKVDDKYYRIKSVNYTVNFTNLNFTIER